MKKKQDFQITIEDENVVKIYIKKRVFKFFYKWVPLMYQDTEHTDPYHVEFTTKDEAIDYIENYIKLI